MRGRGSVILFFGAFRTRDAAVYIYLVGTAAECSIKEDRGAFLRITPHASGLQSFERFTVLFPRQVDYSRCAARGEWNWLVLLAGERDRRLACRSCGKRKTTINSIFCSAKERG